MTSFWSFLEKLKTYLQLVYVIIKKSDRTTVLSMLMIVLTAVGAIIAYEQFQITHYQFALDSFHPQIYPLIDNYTFIQNEKYVKYPFSEKISFSTASSHYLKLEISDVKLISSAVPYSDKYDFPAKIDFGRPVVKFIDRGVINQQFEIPFLLTFDASHLPSYPNDTTLAVISTSTDVRVIDIQDNNKTICCEPLFSGIAIPGQYLPKEYKIKVEDDIK